MTVDVFATPRVVLPEVRERVEMTWTGTDGSVWDIATGEQGVRVLSGVRGLDGPPRQRFTTTSPARAGQMWRGGRDEAREVFWPTLIRGGRGQSYVDLDRAWWASLDPDGWGQWRVYAPDGSYRLLHCQPRGDDDSPMVYLPTLSGSRQVGIYLDADDPYWRGEEVTTVFPVGDTGRPFISPDGAPPFHISQRGMRGLVTVTNPGEVDLWPVWEITASPQGEGLRDVSLSSAELGLHIAIPGELDPGEQWVIDTDARTVYRNDQRVRGALQPRQFAAIPPGSTADLDVSASGVGQVTVRQTPRYRRAW